MAKRQFSREFKLEAVKLVKDRGVSPQRLRCLASEPEHAPQSRRIGWFLCGPLDGCALIWSRRPLNSRSRSGTSAPDLRSGTADSSRCLVHLVNRSQLRSHSLQSSFMDLGDAAFRQTEKSRDVDERHVLIVMQRHHQFFLFRKLRY